MEETFTYLGNEKVDQNFINLYNNNYSIKTIKFELDHEIIKNDFDDIIFEIGNNNIHIIEQSVIYYSNFLIFHCTPFKYFEKIIDNYDIKLYEIRPLHENENDNINVYKEKKYIKCYITLKYNDILIDTSKDSICYYKQIIISNYFNNKEDLKLYFLTWTELDENIYESWLNNFINDYDEGTIINLYSKNSNKKIELVYERNKY